MDLEKSDEKIAKTIIKKMPCLPEVMQAKYNAYKKAEKEFNEVYAPFKELLLDMYDKQELTDKTILINGGMKVTYVSPGIRTTLDSKKLQEEEPEIAKKFMKTTRVSATLRVDGD